MIDPKWDVEDYLASRRGARLRDRPRARDAQPRRPRLRQGPAGEGDRGDDPRAGDRGRRLPARAARRRGRGARRRGHGHGARHAGPPAGAHRLPVADESRGAEPWLVVTGDSLFVGDVARPDLAVDKEEGARGLYASVKRLLALGDFAEVWPGHIGGSLCGGAGMSEKPGTTIGFERRFNRLLASEDEDAFVRALTGNLAPQPPNFQRIVALNRGPLLTERAGRRRAPPGRRAGAPRGGRDADRRARHASSTTRPTSPARST